MFRRIVLFSLSLFIFLPLNSIAQWTTKNFPTQSVIKCFYQMGNYLFAGTNSEGIYKSSDLGETWVASNNGLLNFGIKCFTSFENKLYAGTSYGIFISTDSGLNWDKIGVVLNNKSINALAVMSVNENTYLFAGTAGQGIYKSSDGGLNWESKTEGLINQYISSIVVFGNNVFAGTNLGIFISENFGEIWTERLGNNVITSFAFSDTIIYAGTSYNI